LAQGPFRIFVSDWRDAPGRVPDREVVCAIGDVHGQLGHLRALAGWLAENVLVRREGHRSLVTLGDYVDRGPNGIGVLGFLTGFDPPGVRVTRLIGNHDLFLKTFLFDQTIDFDFVDFWFANGGGSTALELGLRPENFYREDLRALQARARARLPAAAAECLARLRASERIGSYLFVHGGVDPGRPLAEHDLSDLVTMREPFLQGSGWRHDFVVVHGHTVCGPEVRAHRIACDSGAFATGVLTSVQLEADRLRFVIATGAGGPAALREIDSTSAAAFIWTEAPAS
jgi:serine/threonine protein phosphatase 1